MGEQVLLLLFNTTRAHTPDPQAVLRGADTAPFISLKFKSSQV